MKLNAPSFAFRSHFVTSHRSVLLPPLTWSLKHEAVLQQMHTFESLQVGDSFEFKRTLTADDVHAFAELTGDDNPIHLDEEYAKETRFGKPIVHGVLLVGIISKVLGRDFPGHGSIAVGISCRFLRPVPVGSEITIEVKISEKIEKRKHVKARTYIYNNGKMVLGGEATLIPPTKEEKRPQI